MRSQYMQSGNFVLQKMFRSVTKITVSFFCLGFANSDVHFVEGDQGTMYANAPG
jgi:hypothetical protein